MVGREVGPFRVLDRLGSGGMGDVYLAEDPRLGRHVALKCPSDAWLQDPEARVRLQREARAAARLNHPRIAAVYDILDTDGRPYIVMELVQGETLSACLKQGPLPLERALALAAELAEALAAAHEGGVVHRDLKPGNIILTADGHLKVLDFGLAKASLPAISEGEPLTSPGQLLGTPGYVAPEVLLGRPADARCDIYSAGAVLYQMLTGQAPFRQADSMGRALAALLEPVPAAHHVNPALPPEVSRIVARAMARDPDDRYQTAADLRADLLAASRGLEESPTRPLGSRPTMRIRSRPRWQVAAFAAVVLAAIAVPAAWLWKGRADTGLRSNGPTVIAVLPFENLSGDASLQYLGAGLAETMSTMLASVPDVSVIGRAEIHDALERSPELPKVARALGASYLATGGVQRAGGRLQVSLNLLSPDGRILAGDIYEDEYENLFPLQRRIAERLSRYLVGTLSADAGVRIGESPTGSVQALMEYWRGRDLLERPGADTIDQAIAAFVEATRLDPLFAVGYAGLGDAHWRKYELSRDPSYARRAVEATERARQLDPAEPYVGYALAVIYRGNGRLDDSVAELQRVLALQPVHEGARRVLGEIYSEQGRIDDAVEEFRAALRVRPDYWATYRSLGVVQMRAGRYAEAAEAFQHVIELQPDSPVGYSLLGTLHATNGRFEQAQHAYEQSVERGGSPATFSSLGTVYYLLGRYDDALRATQRAIELRPKNALTHFNLGDIYRRLGRETEARERYAHAIELYDAELAVNPRAAAAMAMRGLCEARLGELARARQDVDQALTLAPDDPDVLYQRSVVLALSGETESALSALEMAVDRGQSIELVRRDEDLAALRGTRRFQALLERSR